MTNIITNLTFVKVNLQLFCKKSTVGRPTVGRPTVKALTRASNRPSKFWREQRSSHCEQPKQRWSKDRSKDRSLMSSKDRSLISNVIPGHSDCFPTVSRRSFDRSQFSWERFQTNKNNPLDRFFDRFFNHSQSSWERKKSYWTSVFDHLLNFLTIFRHRSKSLREHSFASSTFANSRSS